MVRSLRKITIIFSFLSFCLYAGSDEEHFLRGNKLYQSAEYDKALASYDMIRNKGRAVFYNMGNCYYYVHNYVHALINWTRAERGATAQENIIIQENKRQAMAKLGKNHEYSFFERIQKYINSASTCISLLVLQLIFILMWYLLIVILHRNSRYKKFMCTLLVMSIVVSGGLLMVHYKRTVVTTGIIIAQKAPLFSGPNNAYHSMGSLALADQIVIKEKRDGWYKIGYSGTIGWIEADAVQII